jgi:DNA ligase-1
MSKFKPMLAPNEEIKLDAVNYPIFASYKLDGIRCLFIKGEMVSRSLKNIQNKQLREKFEALARYSEEHDVILDGEIYSPDFTFQEITRYVMTKDFEDSKSVKKHGEVLTIPEHLKFHLFDVVENEKFDDGFTKRTARVRRIASEFPELIEEVVQFPINKQEEVQGVFDGALAKGYEGLILKSGWC